ncbi:MAG: hypothetical protein G01um101430_597 [Parcubacteria group bacterium Gr01-1014_30]|nr:MAG: hypothetical protein G01um101430_597 [Parcubacteria group bacterium Gr01-1014_30]
MPKKVIDIFPPGTFPSGDKDQRQRNDSPKRTFVQREEQSVLEGKKEREKRSFSSRKTLILITVLLFLTGFAYLHFFAAKAKVEIWLATEVASARSSVTVDANVTAPSFDQRIIPGRILLAESSVSGDFEATGSVLKKAEGVVRLYNSYTTRAETWLQGTRFVSSEGKLFLSKDRIQVPGAAIKNGKLTSSFVDVPVVAAEGGEEYNIGPSNFSIAAFRGTAKFTSYHGESSSPMTGGGTFAQVTKDNLEQAMNALLEKAKAASESDLAKGLAEGSDFIRGSQQVEILETNSSAKEGDTVENFEFVIKTKASVMAFEKRDVEALAEELLAAGLAPEKVLHQESITFKLSPEAVNLPDGRIVAQLDASAKVYREVDLNALKTALAGKFLEESRVLLSSKPGISRSEVKLFPFWLKKVPKQVDRLEVDLRFE